MTIRKARLDKFQTIIDIVKESTEGVDAKGFIPFELCHKICLRNSRNLTNVDHYIILDRGLFRDEYKDGEIVKVMGLNRLRAIKSR